MIPTAIAPTTGNGTTAAIRTPAPEEAGAQDEAPHAPLPAWV